MRDFIKTNEKIIVAAFSLYVLVGIFLGDGRQPFVDVWMGVGILLCLFFARHTSPPASVSRRTTSLWILVIAGLVVQTAFSDSVGYSISATIRYTEGFLVFILFFRIFHDGIRESLERLIVFVSFVSSVTALVFMVRPQWAQNLPLMNLLYANYGHNHVADLLLFAFPVLMYWFVSKTNVFRAVVFTVCATAFLLSFARGAWMLILGYLVFQIIVRKKEQKKSARPLLLGLIALLVGALGFVTLLSYIYKNTHTNLVWWSHEQIIKPLPSEDGRFAYWNQSVRAIRERPWFGSGPGTFLLQSRRLQRTPDTWSWFAHSFPVQTVVELGIVGSVPIFILFIFVLRLVCRAALNNKENGEMRALAWGAVLTFCYSLFEFNLNYSVVWLFFWLATAVLVRENQKGPQKNIKVSRFQRPLVFLAIVITGVFCSMSVASMVTQTYLKKSDISFFIAPFDAKAAENFLVALKESGTEIKKQEVILINLFHKNNPETYPLLIDLAKSEPEKQRLKEQLASLDPWKRNELNLSQYYFELGNLALAQAQIEKTRLLWQTADKQYAVDTNYADRPFLSRQMLELGDRYYEKANPQDASRWYVEAQSVDKWALHTHRPIFLDHPLSNEDTATFFLGLGAIPGEYFGQYRKYYVREYLNALKNLARTFAITDFSSHAKKIVTMDPWMRFEVWTSVGLSLLNNAKEERAGNHNEKALTVLLEGVSFWKALTIGQEQFDWNLQSEFANELVSVGNVLAPSDLNLTVRAYRTAASLVPDPVNKKNSWFAQYSANTIQYPSLISYINQEKNTDKSGTQYISEAIVLLVEKYITDDRPKEAAELILKPKDLSVVDQVRRKKIAVEIQKKADEYLAAGRQKDAEYAVNVLAGILPKDYWAQTQPGNFYAEIGDVDRARRAYEDCLASFGGNHADCQGGLTGLLDGTQNSKRYQRVSRIIRETEV